MGRLKEVYLNNVPHWQPFELDPDDYEFPDEPLTDETRQEMENGNNLQAVRKERAI
jgi:hypothetical protein